MKKLILALALALALPLAATANPTGAPLLSHPVEPCRILDTRTSLGALPAGLTMDVFVRGSALQASDGALQSDCGIPASAEAVKVNITVVSPTASGHLRINGTGFVYGPNGAYSRLTFVAGQNTANEIEISLCNAFLYPYPHVPCLFDDQGRYSDFQVWNMSGGSVHVVGDVVGFLSRNTFIASP